MATIGNPIGNPSRVPSPVGFPPHVLHLHVRDFHNLLVDFASKPQKNENIWVCLKMLCAPLYPMVLLIIIPFLNGYFIGNIPYFQTNPDVLSRFLKNYGDSLRLVEEPMRKSSAIPGT